MATLSGSTNPYLQWHDTNSREHMSLRTAAISNFEPDKIFNLTPTQADDFVNALEEYGQIFGYNGSVARVPTECDINAADPNDITFREKVDILTTWQVITDETVQKCATMLWGDKQWIHTANGNKEIQQPSFARGEVTQGGHNLTTPGKALILKRFHSTILASQVMKMIGPDGRKALKVHRHDYEWVNPDTGELIHDGLTILHLVLKKLRPNVKISVFKEIEKMTKIHPGDFKFDITQWDVAMEHGFINISLKLSGSYPDHQFINDYFKAALDVPVKSFNSELSSMRNRWLLGMDATLTKEHIQFTVTQLYTNLEADGTWERELAESSQIIALQTKVSNLEGQMKQTIALATQSHPSPANTAAPSSGTGPGGHRGQKQPYTVKPWRLVFVGDTIQKDNRTWH